MRPTIALISLAVLAALPSNASQVHYRTITLDELARRTTHVLFVRRLKPFFTTETVDITPKGKRPDPAQYPAYRRPVYRFQVERALRLPKDEKLPKQIEVVSANDEANLELHRKYYVEKIGRSPIYESYESPTSRKAEAAERAILFLVQARAKPPRFRYVVQGAAELVSEEPRVKRALAKSGAPSSTEP